VLAGTDAAEHPFWSPDSKSIAYFAGRKLWRVDPAGGVPLAICDAPGFDRCGTWSSDGRILLGTVWSGLLQVPSSGGTPTPLTMLDAARGEAAHRWPQALPGGRFLYWAQNNSEGQSAVYASSLAKPAERVRLTASEGQALFAGSYLLWLRGDTLVAQDFDVVTLRLNGEPRPVAGPVSRVGINGQINVTAATGMLLYFAPRSLSQLTWVDRTGKPVGVLGEPREYNMFRLSPDGRYLVASITGDTPRAPALWLLDKERALSRFTFGSGTNLYAVWSPDGRTIVFASGNPWNLFRKEATGAGVEQRLTQSRNVQHPTDWSLDGRFILYYEVAPDTQRDLWILPVTPAGKPAGTPRVYLRTPFNELLGCFSPEASPRWVPTCPMNPEGTRFTFRRFLSPEANGRFRLVAGVSPPGAHAVRRSST
jgi:hypothetical protein